MAHTLFTYNVVNLAASSSNSSLMATYASMNVRRSLLQQDFNMIRPCHMLPLSLKLVHHHTFGAFNLTVLFIMCYDFTNSSQTKLKDIILHDKSSQQFQL
ncbi:hypothetical protein BLOT_006340 [Blomia tropicalis]|nr:hypothetical protein BLOT_006340 [Blomia tropicalis]